MKYYFYLFLFFSSVGLAFASEKNPVPRFVSLRPKEVNLRVGPGPNYPIEWVYHKAGLPVEVIAEFDTWRKIRDQEGVEGWVHQTMLSPKRHGIVKDTEVILYSQPDLESCPLVRLAGKVVVNIVKCRDDWCQIRINDFKGWVKRCSLWGLYPQESIK
jgi:SH3-like domain-containing protein